jgi:hypothetical protein
MPSVHHLFAEPQTMRLVHALQLRVRTNERSIGLLRLRYSWLITLLVAHQRLTALRMCRIETFDWYRSAGSTKLATEPLLAHFIPRP